MDLVPAVLWAKSNVLSVAGLDETEAQRIIYSLQQCTHGPEDEVVLHAWVRALQLCHCFHQRLLADLDTIEQALAFWNKRLQQGSHVQFMLLQRGPLAFARHASRSLQHTYNWLVQAVHRVEAAAAPAGGTITHSSATANGTGPAPHDPTAHGAPAASTPTAVRQNAFAAAAAAATAAPPSRDASGTHTSAANKMQARVVLLEAYRNVLAQTLAQVSLTSRNLWLNSAMASSTGGPAWVPRHPVQGSRATSGAGGLPGTDANKASNPALLLQSCTDTVHHVMTELEGVLSGMQQQLKELGSEQTTRAALQEAAVARALTGCASLNARSRPANGTTINGMATGMNGSMARQGSSSPPGNRQAGLTTPTQSVLQPRHSSNSDGILQELNHVRLGEVLNVREARPRQLHNNPLASPEPVQLPGRSAPTSPGKSSGIGSFRMLPPPPPPPQDPATLQVSTRRLEAALGVTLLPRLRAHRVSTSGADHVKGGGAAVPPGLLSPQVSASVARGAAALWHVVEGACEELGLDGALSRGLPQSDVTGPDARERGRSLRAADALAAAEAAAKKAGSLVHIPTWALMPSWIQRNWLGCTVASGVALYAAHWVWKHSAASGSDDLSRWTRTAWEATQASLQVHLVEPLLAVHEELTRTFRDRSSIVSPEEFDADKKSLLRMLSDFEHDSKGKHASSSSSSSSTAGRSSAHTATSPAGSTSHADTASGAVVQSSMTQQEQEALLTGMQLVMRSYEREMRDPVRNLFMGQLARAMLIQVQRLKVDTEAAMLEMDQILKANELSIALVAAIPALAITMGAVTTLGRWLVPRAPDLKRAAVPCRMAVASLERALQRLADQEAQALHTQGLAGPYHTHELIQITSISPTRQAGPDRLGQPDAWGNAALTAWLHAEGMCVYRMHKVYQEAVQLFRLHDRTSRFSEWPSLSVDLAELSTTQGSASRMRVLDRMMRTYKVFQA